MCSKLRILQSAAEAMRSALEDAARDTGATGSTLPGSVFESLYSSAMAQIYSSREAFVQTAQSALTTMLLFFTAGAGLLFPLLTADHCPAKLQTVFLCALAWAAFSAPALTARRWMAKAEAGYDLYVAAVIHATIVSHALRLPLSHRWLQLVEECVGVPGWFIYGRRDRNLRQESTIFCFNPAALPLEPLSHTELMAVWKAGGPNMLHFYSAIFAFGTRLVFALATILCATLLCVALYSPQTVFPTK